MAPVNKPKHKGKALVAGATAGVFGKHAQKRTLSSTGIPTMRTLIESENVVYGLYSEMKNHSHNILLDLPCSLL